MSSLTTNVINGTCRVIKSEFRNNDDLAKQKNSGLLSWGIFLAFFMFTTAHVTAWGQAVEVGDQDQIVESEQEAPSSTRSPVKVGPEAARKYFKRPASTNSKAIRLESKESSGNRYLSLQAGGFISQDSYKWGVSRNKDVGQFNAGVTYKIGEWPGSMDLLFKSDITTYRLEEGRAVKLSLMPAIAFPDSNSGFPLYFGAGAGVGAFFKQIPKESALTLDYTLFIGARFYDLFKKVGLLIETGVKNHVSLLSDGQFNGVFFDLGVVFRF